LRGNINLWLKYDSRSNLHRNSIVFMTCPLYCRLRTPNASTVPCTRPHPAGFFFRAGWRAKNCMPDFDLIVGVWFGMGGFGFKPITITRKCCTIRTYQRKNLLLKNVYSYYYKFSENVASNDVLLSKQHYFTILDFFFFF